LCSQLCSIRHWSGLRSGLLWSDLFCVPFGLLYSTVGQTRRHLLEGFHFHNGCLHCLGNRFLFLGNTLILSLAYWLLREQRLLVHCLAMDVSVIFQLQYSSFLGSVYQALLSNGLFHLVWPRVLTSHCLAMDTHSDILAFVRHASIWCIHNMYVMSQVSGSKMSFVCLCHQECWVK
jgi:hypothetical protein